MDDATLSLLVAHLESDHVERTQSTNDMEKFAQAVCAFANDMPGNRQPGYLFVGSLPDGQASGATVDDEMLRRLGDLQRNGNIQPLPAINAQKRRLRGGDMAVVEALPADQPPVRCLPIVVETSRENAEQRESGWSIHRNISPALADETRDHFVHHRAPGLHEVVREAEGVVAVLVM